MTYTRQQYMSGEVSHANYYAQFVTPEIKAKVDNALGYRLRNYPHDEHLNDIQLAIWDNLAGSRKLARMQGDYRCTLNAGEDKSLATQVCILKQAARQIIAESRG